MVLNVILMVIWIVLLSQRSWWGAMTFGVVAFALILAGLSLWLVLTLKEIGLNNRQANFVDSVTHELKSPIAALQLYLETLRMRHIDDAKRDEFHAIMETELKRLDNLINQLLEVGRLDAIGENEDPVEIELLPLIERHAETACTKVSKQRSDVFQTVGSPISVTGRQIVLDLIFANLIDNAVKYGGDPPVVHVLVRPFGRSKVRISITNNGTTVDADDRNKIFQVFYRGGSELERRQKGTGLGLYIVNTLVRRIRGRISVHDRADGEEGCTFVLELPDRVPEAEMQASSTPTTNGALSDTDA